MSQDVNGWVTIELSNSSRLLSFSMGNNFATYKIASFTIKGSNDNTNWNTIGSYTAENTSVTQNFDVNYSYTGGFKYYKIFSNSSHVSSSAYDRPGEKTTSIGNLTMTVAM